MSTCPNLGDATAVAKGAGIPITELVKLSDGIYQHKPTGRLYETMSQTEYFADSRSFEEYDMFTHHLLIIVVLKQEPNHLEFGYTGETK